MKNSTIYSQLLDLLLTSAKATPPCIFGTLTAVSPLTVKVGDTKITKGLCWLENTAFYAEDIGKRVALLPCEDCLLLLHTVKGGET